MALILNAPLIIWAIVELGYKLVVKTIFAIILTSISIDVIAMFIPPYQGDQMLVAIFAGVTEGAGLALIFIRGGTTGGTDTAARLLGTQDVALIAFAWLIFLGSDVAMRGSGLIGVDLFVKKFPAGVQKVLDILFKVIIAAFLCVLIYYGYGMTTSGWARQITSLHISYSWVTMAVPVGSFFMLISTIRNIIERVKTPAGQEVKHEAGRDVG